MKIKKLSALIALLALSSTPTKPVDDPLGVVGGIAAGTAVVIGGVLFVNWLFSDPVYYCPACDGVIDPKQCTLASCGHRFHTWHHDRHIICRYCESRNRGWRTFWSILWGAAVVADVVAQASVQQARETREAEARAAEQEAKRKEANATKNDTNIAMRDATQLSREFYGKNVTPAQVIDQQRQIQDEGLAKKIAQQESAAARGGYATPAQAMNDQTNAHGQAHADTIKREQQRTSLPATNRNDQGKYPKRTFESEEAMIEICTICQGPLAEQGNDLVNLNDPRYAATVTTLPCGNKKHSFHTACLKEWSKTNPVCPNCRAPFDKNKV